MSSATLTRTAAGPVVLRTRPAFDLDDEQFFEFCQLNDELRIERSADGDIEIMPPTGGMTSDRNAVLITMITTWALGDGTGVSYDSNGGYRLRNGATRSPDASWVEGSRLANLTNHQASRFLPLCPDFVVELLSPSDTLVTIQAKMEEYIANGARLGWLLDPDARKAYVYRPGADVEATEADELSGEGVLPGFTLRLALIWEDRTRFAKRKDKPDE